MQVEWPICSAFDLLSSPDNGHLAFSISESALTVIQPSGVSAEQSGDIKSINSSCLRLLCMFCRFQQRVTSLPRFRLPAFAEQCFLESMHTSEEVFEGNRSSLIRALF